VKVTRLLPLNIQSPPVSFSFQAISVNKGDPEPVVGTNKRGPSPLDDDSDPAIPPLDDARFFVMVSDSNTFVSVLPS
jgi:hypothetical protein